ncbi:spermatogenesis-associated protein 7-like [Theristicus caerulescens]
MAAGQRAHGGRPAVAGRAGGATARPDGGAPPRAAAVARRIPAGRRLLLCGSRAAGARRAPCLPAALRLRGNAAAAGRGRAAGAPGVRGGSAALAGRREGTGGLPEAAGRAAGSSGCQEPGSSQWSPVTGAEAMGANRNTGGSLSTSGITLACEGSQIAMVPTYSMLGPFRGHMSLKSSPFSPGPSCKFSNQYIIQDHMASHHKNLMSAKGFQRIAFVIFLSVILFFNLQARWSLLENCHLYLTSGQNNCSRTKREQPPSVSFQKLTSRTLMPVPTARKTIQNTAQHALSQTSVHNFSINRSPASPLLQTRMQSGSHNRKKAFQNSFNKTYSGDLLDKHSIYFTEKKQCFTPQILKTSHQSFLVKYRYYNPPPKKKSSFPGRPSLKSADVNNEKKRELHRCLLCLYISAKS